MTLRDKIMDKYWLEFLNFTRLDTSQYHSDIQNGEFWVWFKNKKMTNPPNQKLEDYL